MPLDQTDDENKTVPSHWQVGEANGFAPSKRAWRHLLVGRDRRGVRTISTNLGPLPLAGLLPFVGLILALAAPWLSDSATRLLWLTLMSLFVLAIITAIRMRTGLRRVASIQKISERLGGNVEDVSRIAREQNILPRYSVNGTDLYDLSDFNDVGTLLRASSVPSLTSNTLLRAATGSEPANATRLLRAVAGENAQVVPTTGSAPDVHPMIPSDTEHVNINRAG